MTLSNDNSSNSAAKQPTLTNCPKMAFANPWYLRSMSTTLFTRFSSNPPESQWMQAWCTMDSRPIQRNEYPNYKGIMPFHPKFVTRPWFSKVLLNFSKLFQNYQPSNWEPKALPTQLTRLLTPVHEYRQCYFTPTTPINTTWGDRFVKMLFLTAP